MKRQVTEKLLVCLQDTRDLLLTALKQTTYPWPEGMDLNYGKISKGENYQGFPYMILDFPRLFRHDRWFAYRTMIWWGHHVAFTFLLKGPEAERALRQLQRLPPAQWLLTDYVCISEDPWQHHFKPGYVQRLRELNSRDLSRRVAPLPYLKLMRRRSLNHLERLPDDAVATWQHYMQRLLL